MANTATRLITLIMLLQRAPNQKAAELAAKLGVSVRSLHRYLGMLDEMGIPVYSERGPYGGFSLVRGYRMPPLVFTPEEAVSIYLGTSLVGELWGRLYQDAAQGALAKLDNVLPDEQRQEVSWARRALVATGMQRSGLESLSPNLEMLRRAVREQRRVQMVSGSGSRPEPQERELDAYALVYRWGWWYVIGFCHLRQEVRLFRLDRIQSLLLLSDKFEYPAGLDIREYVDGVFQGPAQFLARMRFFPEGASIALDNRASWVEVGEQPDGAVEVTFFAPDLNWAASTVLAYGPLVEVLEPPELRQTVCEWASVIARRYSQS
jgi:predicted DNA-binding transcriptional regulator YafY